MPDYRTAQASSFVKDNIATPNPAIVQPRALVTHHTPFHRTTRDRAAVSAHVSVAQRPRGATWLRCMTTSLAQAPHTTAHLHHAPIRTPQPVRHANINSEQSGTTASGGAPSQLTSTYLTHLLQTGALQKHIKTVLQPAYARRYSVLLHAIQTHLLPLGFELPQPGTEVVGGYFVWLSLPEPLTATSLARRCRLDEDLIIAPGPIFEVPGDEEAVGFNGHVRLCFAWVDEGDLAEGVERLARVARRMLQEGSSATHQVEDQDEDRNQFK
jgi:hypothetical protein